MKFNLEVVDETNFVDNFDNIYIKHDIIDQKVIAYNYSGNDQVIVGEIIQVDDEENPIQLRNNHIFLKGYVKPSLDNKSVRGIWKLYFR